MKTRHAKTNFFKLLPFLNAVKANEGHKKFEREGYMPLSIERLYYQDHEGNDVFGMMHYTTQNGDLMRDPDMTFSVNMETGEVLPLTYQNDFVGLYQEVFKEIDGKLMYSKRLLTQLDEFLWMWLKNIEAQGFTATA